METSDETPLDEKKELLSKSELSVWLDDYDDIFSDFDPRPLDERALSDDFLAEVRKMVREKPSGNVQLKMLIPAAKHRKDFDAVVIKNLHEYFQDAAELIKHQMKATQLRGLLLTSIGLVLMIITAYIVSRSNHSFLFTALQIVLEPASWFMAWTGMDSIFNNFRDAKPKLDFNRKMSNADIIFLSY